MPKTAQPDSVNHPRHYTAHPSGIECIEITRHMGFNLGNAFKYIWRADLKHDDGGLEDLEKSIWYIRDEITKRKAAAAKPAAPTDGRPIEVCFHGRPIGEPCAICDIDRP